MTGLLLALIAGILTTLSPYVLPVLPIVLIGALQRHRLAPLALVCGMTAMFAFTGTVPCSGPTLGAAMGLAAARDNLSGAAAVMLVFGLGAGLPMLVLAYGSRQTLKARRDRLARVAAWSKPLLGAVLLVLGAAVLFGLDHMAESWLVAAMPDWMLELSTRF